MNRADEPAEDPAEAIRAQYLRRGTPPHESVELRRLLRRERKGAAAEFLKGLAPLESRTLLEIGASQGINVSFFLELGFRPEHIVLNDIRPEQLEAGRKRLPPEVRTVGGDAAGLDLPPFDVVYASTVFTSILSAAHRKRVAAAVWRLVRPGGGVMLYDFTYNNPRNPDVRRLPVGEIRSLFPEGRLQYCRVTLAPPIARRIPLTLYPLLNFPWLRSHVLCWIDKP